MSEKICRGCGEIHPCDTTGACNHHRCRYAKHLSGCEQEQGDPYCSCATRLERRYAIDEGCCWNYVKYYCKGPGCECSCHTEKGQTMRKTDRPADTQECGREKCGHEFGLHFVANDRQTVGCAWRMDDQRDGLSLCECNGFLISYTYPAHVGR